nr:hypothetical protein [Klebsiella pneumoniae subsp. pneumoniae]
MTTTSLPGADLLRPSAGDGGDCRHHRRDEEEKVVENAASIGNEVLRPGLEALAEKHAIIGEVRGRGLFQALELVSSREQKRR